MQKEIEEFLFDKSRNDEVFEDSMGRNFKIHKENYNERFDVIYTKNYNPDLIQSSYSIGGYLDKIKKTIYDTNFDMQYFLGSDGEISIASFSNLYKEMGNKVNIYINNYLKNNQSKLARYGKEKYNKLNNYEIEGHKRDVAKRFVKEDKVTLDLKIEYQSYELTSYGLENGDNIIKYLDNSGDFIKKFSEKIIDRDKEKLGLAVLVFRDKVKYLKDIEKNQENKYAPIYTNRNIYQAIRYLYAREVNIKIKYDERKLNFRFDYKRLLDSLKNLDSGTCGFNNAYDRVSDFLKDNNPALSSQYRPDFSFSNIEAITYSRREVYNKQDYENKKLRKNKGMER